MCGRLGIESLSQSPWQQGVERSGQIISANLLTVMSFL